MPTWVIHVFFRNVSWMWLKITGNGCVQHPNMIKSAVPRRVSQTFPRLGSETFRHLSSMWLQFARRIDQSWWMQQNLNLKTTRLSFSWNVSVPIWCFHCLLHHRLGLRKFQSVRFSLQCYELVWWRPLGIPGYLWCPEMSLYIDSIWFHATPMP